MSKTLTLSGPSAKRTRRRGFLRFARAGEGVVASARFILALRRSLACHPAPWCTFASCSPPAARVLPLLAPAASRLQTQHGAPRLVTKGCGTLCTFCAQARVIHQFLLSALLFATPLYPPHRRPTHRRSERNKSVKLTDAAHAHRQSSDSGQKASNSTAKHRGAATQAKSCTFQKSETKQTKHNTAAAATESGRS